MENKVLDVLSKANMMLQVLDGCQIEQITTFEFLKDQEKFQVQMLCREYFPPTFLKPFVIQSL